MNEEKYSIFAKTQISYSMNDLANHEKGFLNNDDNFILFKKIKNELHKARGREIYQIVRDNKDFFDFLASREYISSHIKNIFKHIYEYDMSKPFEPFVLRVPKPIKPTAPTAPATTPPTPIPPISPAYLSPTTSSSSVSTTSVSTMSPKTKKPTPKITSSHTTLTSIVAEITPSSKPKKSNKKVKPPKEKKISIEKEKKETKEKLKGRIHETILGALGKSFKLSNIELEDMTKLISNNDAYKQITTAYKLRYVRILNALKEEVAKELENNKTEPETKSIILRNKIIEEYIDTFNKYYSCITLTLPLPSIPKKVTTPPEAKPPEAKPPKIELPKILRNRETIFENSNLNTWLTEIKENKKDIKQITENLTLLLDKPNDKQNLTNKDLHKTLIAIEGTNAKIKENQDLINQYISRKIKKILIEDKAKSISPDIVATGLNSIYNHKSISDSFEHGLINFIQNNKVSDDSLRFIYLLYQYTSKSPHNLFANGNLSKFPENIKDDYLQCVLQDFQYKTINKVKQTNIKGLKNITEDAYTLDRLQKESVEKSVFENTIKQLVSEIMTVTIKDEEKAKYILSLAPLCIDVEKEITTIEPDAEIAKEKSDEETKTVLKEEISL